MPIAAAEVEEHLQMTSSGTFPLRTCVVILVAIQRWASVAQIYGPVVDHKRDLFRGAVNGPSKKSHGLARGTSLYSGVTQNPAGATAMLWSGYASAVVVRVGLG